jgi:AmpE protein
VAYLAILLVYALERRHGVYPRIQRDAWFYRFSAAARQAMGAVHVPSGLQWLVVVSLPCLVLLQVQDMVGNLLFGLVALALYILVLICSLGRDDYAAQLDNYLAHWREGDLQGAYHVARNFMHWAGADEVGNPEQLHRYGAEALLYQGFERWFCVVFWFAALGPWAALAYRLAYLDLTAQGDSPQAQRAGPALFIRLVEWLPARVLALSFCLAGNSSACFATWRAHCTAADVGTPELLRLCALAALHGDAALVWGNASQHETTMGPQGEAIDEIKGLQSLLQRAAVVWLVGLAVLVLVLE